MTLTTAPQYQGEMGTPIQVLHVDDDSAFAEMTAEFLEREDERFDVQTAGSAAEGLERVRAGGIDCIVSDYDMPRQNGIEFLESVRENHPDVPFVLFTGKGSEEVASEAISAGVTDYLEKGGGPSQYTVLANRVGNAVEQYRSRRELEASRERLSLFFEQSPLGVIEWNDEFEIARVNEAAVEILGYDAEVLRGKSWRWIIPDTEVDHVGDIVDSLLANRGGYRSVNENVRPDGERIVCEWHNRIVTDNDGNMLAAFSQFQDVTEREEREKRLRRSTARLEALFEESPDMINIHDTEGNIVDPNPRLCEETGYDANELTEMKVWDLDQTVDPEELRTVWERMGAGDRRRFEVVYRRRDGSTFPVEVHVRRLDLEGQGRFVAISRDISARKKRERDLKETKERLDTVASNVPVVLFALDAEGVFTLSEGRELSTLGLEPGEVVGESALDRYAGEPQVIDAIERSLDGEAVTMVQEIDDRFFETEYQPIFDDDGTVSEVIGIATDITERRRREAELERKNDQLEEFVGVVSHDLQNPLNVAEGRLEIAREAYDSDHLDEAARALDRMEELITDLLRLAREGERVNEIESVALADLVEDCWYNVEAPAADLAVETRLTLRGDPGRLRHLLTNLLQNAVEHGSTDGPVTVTVGTLADGSGFYVADDGPGIPDDERERIFESGYSTDTDGTGFGLAIAKEVTEAHGWSLGVTEGAAGGARFEIRGVDVVE